MNKNFNIFLKELNNLSTKRRDKSSPEDTKIKYNNTFVIEYEHNQNPSLDYTNLIKILTQNGLKQSFNPRENHILGIITSKYYETKFLLLNNFQFVKDISDKYTLYINLQTFFPDHYNKNYPKSFLLTEKTTFTDLDNKIYISRPIAEYAGNNITIISNEKELENAKKLMLNSRYSSGLSLTEYVSNLVKYKGRKMHLRAYCCITLINNVFNSYLLDVGGIYLAKDKYKNADWYNMDIHDTHLSTSGMSVYFPDDLYNNNTEPIITSKEWNIIYDNMKENLKYVSMCAFNNFFKYLNSENAWEVFGVDFFIRDDLSTFIIEINAKNVGYKETKNLMKPYWDWINDICIKPILFPYLKIEPTPSNKSIYTSSILNY
jgi:hypothetical protein